MLKKLLLILFLIGPASHADLSGGGLMDYYGNGVTSNVFSGTRNALDVETVFSGSVVDPRARTWSLLHSTDSVASWTFDGSGNAINSTSNALNAFLTNTSIPVTQSTSPWVSNVTQFGGNNVVTGTGASGTGVPRVTVSNDSNILTSQSTSPWVDNVSQFGGSNVVTGTGASGSGIPRVTVSNDSKVIAWDGTNTTAVKAASTAPVATDTALVVGLTPNGNQATATNQTSGGQKTQVVDGSGNVQPAGDITSRGIHVTPGDGTNQITVKAASTAAVATDTSQVMALSPNTPLPAGTSTLGAVNQGTANTAANGWPVKVTDGTNVGAVKAASTAPLATDPAQVMSISPNSFGQGTNSTSVPVVLSSNQTGINSNLDKNQTGTIAALNATVSFATNGMSSVVVTVTGTWSATLAFQGFDGTNWINATGLSIPSGGVASSLTANGSALINVGGFAQFRILASAYTSGTANIFMNTGSGASLVELYNTGQNPLAIKGNGTAGTPDSNVVSIQGVSGGTVVPGNITQFGGVAVSTGTGASGTGIPRVTVSNDSQVKVWDGTNQSKVVAGSSVPGFSDTAFEITQRPDWVGTPTQSSVSCAATSTTLLAAAAASFFLSIRNPTTATVTIWINTTGSAAVVGAPSIDLPPGAEADFNATGPWLPTSQINCISSGAASSVTLLYK